MLNDFLSGSAAWGVLLTLAAFALGALINRITGKAIFNPPAARQHLCHHLPVGVQDSLRRLQGQRRPGELPAAAGHRGPGHPAV